jgi:hypothetical protein
MSFFNPCLKFSTGEVLAHTVNPSWWRTHFIANQISPLPWNSRLGHFFDVV